MISTWGYTPFIFEKETICYDNLLSLNPALVILGSLYVERTYRFMNTLRMINHNLPVLIISVDQAIQDFIQVNEFGDVSVIKALVEQSEIKRAISKVKDHEFIKKMNQDRPLIIGNSSEMVKIKKMILELSRSKETVLVRGETGTGKELVARAIHSMSDRGNNPFVKVNTAALSPQVFEDELFGQNRGLYSSNYQNKKECLKSQIQGQFF
jgi:transcriptional regulator with PAS, ATPase and Fis domain